jgi:DNA-directed RNA polymerase I subunit RPA49
VDENPNKLSPLVGYFPTGFNPYGGDIQPKVGVFRHQRRSTRLELVVNSNCSNGVDFVGTNYLGEATAAQVCTYALGVLDKVTNSLKMVPIAGNKIFRLEPKIASAGVTDNNESPEITKEKPTMQETIEKINDLTQRYSTKKTINKVKKNKSLRQEQDAKSQAMLEEQLRNEEINEKAFETAGNEGEGRNIPPYDLSATSPEKAYSLDKIILKGEWDYLVDILHLSQEGDQLNPELYPSFVIRRVYKLDQIKDEEIKQRLACMLSYITHLVKFKDKHSMDGFASAKHHKIPNIFSVKFSEMFGNSDSKRLADEKRDLIISYILVLTLFVDDFRTDPSDIAKDLRMSNVQLRPHWEQLGCKIFKEEKADMVKLSVPLKFQTLRRKRRRN